FLWGGKPDDIFKTIRVGINWTHPDTRVSQMPAFGRDQMLPREDVLKVASYVYALSHPGAKDVDPAKVEAGKASFSANCVACHGDNARGNPQVGAPDLPDPFSIYGGAFWEIANSTFGGRQGRMPSWENRLSNLDRKILALYLVDKRSAAP